MNIFVIDDENFYYDFLIGLDCIKKFRLMQNEKLNIIQCNHSNKENKNQNEKNNKNKYSETNMLNVRIPVVLGEKNEQDVILSSEVWKQEINCLNQCEINFNEHIHLKEFEISVNHLDLSKQTEIDKLIEKYKPVFAKDQYNVGTVRGYEAHIDLTVDKYCCKRPYRCITDDRKEIENQISKLLKKKLIEESYNPFAAPVTLAYKKEDGKRSRLYRFPRIE